MQNEIRCLVWTPSSSVDSIHPVPEPSLLRSLFSVKNYIQPSKHSIKLITNNLPPNPWNNPNKKNCFSSPINRKFPKIQSPPASLFNYAKQTFPIFSHKRSRDEKTPKFPIKTSSGSSSRQHRNSALKKGSKKCFPVETFIVIAWRGVRSREYLRE